MTTSTSASCGDARSALVTDHTAPSTWPLPSNSTRWAPKGIAADAAISRAGFAAVAMEATRRTGGKRCIEQTLARVAGSMCSTQVRGSGSPSRLSRATVRPPTERNAAKLRLIGEGSARGAVASRRASMTRAGGGLNGPMPAAAMAPIDVPMRTSACSGRNPVVSARPSRTPRVHMPPAPPPAPSTSPIRPPIGVTEWLTSSIAATLGPSEPRPSGRRPTPRKGTAGVTSRRASIVPLAQMPEWSKGAACKAVIRGFKSRSALQSIPCPHRTHFLPSSKRETGNERGKWVRVPLFSPLRVRPGNPGPLAQLARALPRHGRGHWFESSTAHSG